MEKNNKTFKDGGKQAVSEYEKNQAAILEAQRKRLEEEKKKEQEGKKSQSVTWKEWADAVVSISKDALSSIQTAFDGYYQNQLDSLSEWKDENLSGIDDWINQEMERQGVREETQNERLEAEIAQLQVNLSSKQSATDRANTEKSLKEKQDELKRLQIMEEGKKKEEKIQDQARKKETALKKKQFEENKTLSIINIWLNAASSVMGWWAAFANMGIPGIALAAVMTVATLAMAGVQTGLVASQSFQAEKGGVIPGMSSTGDKINIGVNSMERVLTPEQNRAFEEMVFNGKGSGINIYGNIYVTSNDPDDFAEQLKELRRKEMNR